MDNLKTVLEQELEKYTAKGLNSISYLLTNTDRTAYTILTIAEVKGQVIANTDLIVRLEDDLIVIDLDNNNKSLVEALVAQGIPRQQISLSYAGELLRQQPA